MLLFGRPHDDSKGQSSSVDSDASRRFDKALFATLDALEAQKVDYCLIGGIAASGLGRPRPTQDIDIFVRPEDAEGTLEVLKERGFETNRFNPSWIYKAYKENVLIDIIFRSEGGFYFDDEMKNHAVEINYHGRKVRVVSPEDFILIKCAVHSEEGHHHWHDALSVLSQAKLDWEYLLHRARKAPRRLLALLIYAQSCDIWIPNSPIVRLYETIFQDGAGSSRATQQRVETQRRATLRPQVRSEIGDTYLAAKVRESLVKNESIGELGIDVLVQDHQILVRGQVWSQEQRRATIDLIQKMAPDHRVEDQMHVVEWKAPTEVEALQ